MLQGQIKNTSVNEVEMSLAPEEIFLISNSEHLLAGESLLYAANVRRFASLEASDISKIAYVELIGKDRTRVFKHKLKLENGSGEGYFFIPADLKTGNYKLVAYTNWTRNNKFKNYFVKELYIINPFLKQDKIMDPENNVVIIEMEKGNSEFNYPISDFINIKTNKNSYKPREEIKLSIAAQGKGSKGIYTVSVKKMDALKPIKNKVLTSSNKSNQNIFYLPEMRGELISGTVKNIEQVPVANQNISLTIPGKDFVFKLAKTNADGEFFFNVYENYNTSEAHIQLYNPQIDRLEIEIEKRQFEELDDLEFSTVALNLNIESWLTKQSIDLQIENAYFARKKDSLIPRVSNDAFFDPLEINYKLDDYTRFPSVQETFIEVINRAGIRKEGNTYKFIVFNFENPSINSSLNELPPLILVDGILQEDYAEIINYDADKIEEINVVVEQYRYGPEIFGGIISFKTKNGDFRPSENLEISTDFHLISPISKKVMYNPNYPSGVELDRIPDFRTQLLWEPNINIDEDVSNFSFFSSDNTGDYQILVEGFTATGKHVIAKSYIKVQ